MNYPNSWMQQMRDCLEVLRMINQVELTGEQSKKLIEITNITLDTLLGLGTKTDE